MSDVMRLTSLPHDLCLLCRSTFAKCSEFDSDAALQAVFVTNELRPFRDRLPTAMSKSGRVDACLAFLLDQRLSDGQSALPLFVETLRGRYHRNDANRKALDELLPQVCACCDPDTHNQATRAAAEGHAEDPGDTRVKEFPNWVKQIPDPFIRKLEEKLRMNESYWQSTGIQMPAWDTFFTSVYFSRKADKVLELRDVTDELQDSLDSTNLGDIEVFEDAQDVLDQVLADTVQLNQLINLRQHALGITIEKTASQVIADAQTARTTLRLVALEAVSSPDVPPHLRGQLRTLLSALVVSLDELQKYVQEISLESQRIWVSLN